MRLQEVTMDMAKELPPLQNPDILIGVDDLTDLSYLHEPAGACICQWTEACP